MIGRVVSIKMNKTVTVLVERVAKHPLYRKTFIRSKKYSVDDQLGVKEGDIVEIVKIRPISKNKHWQIAKVVGKNLIEINEGVLKAQAAEVISEVMPEASEPEDQGADMSENQKAGKPEEPVEKSKRRSGSKKKEIK